MPLIVTGKAPSKGERNIPGHKSSALLANQAKAELDKIVGAVLEDLQKTLPDWDQHPDIKATLLSLGDLQAKWQEEIQATATRVASKWVDAVDKNSKAEITGALKRVLGVSSAQILDTPAMKATVGMAGREAAAVIKTIPSELLSGVVSAVSKSYMQEPLPEGRTLAEEIAFLSGHAKKRARFIAKDQTQKMHGFVTQTRQAELGVTEFIWRTMRDARVVGTPSGRYPEGNKLHGNHYAREGKKYRWDDLPPDGAPGWPIGCRCYAEPVIDLDKLDLIEVSTPTMEAVEDQTPKAMTKAAPEPFPGYKAKYDDFIARLVEQDEEKSGIQARYNAGEVTKKEFDATMTKIRRQAQAVRSALSRLKAKGRKAVARNAPVTTTTPVVQQAYEKPKLRAKAKHTPPSRFRRHR